MSGPRRKDSQASRVSRGRLVTAPLPYRSPSTTKLAQRQLPSSSSSASPPPLQSFRKGQCIIGGLAVYAFTAYGTYLYKSYHLAVARSREIDIPDDVSNRYDNTADHFDSEVDTTEWITGITGLRSRLANKAYGNVLEVAAGTGRNLQYYPLEKCTSLTLVDLSERMLDRARDKFAHLYPTRNAPIRSVQDASQPVPCHSTAGFDTIVQTMGLCSTPNPSKLLENLGRLANAEHGRILLLEHGRSHYQWLNGILDSLAPAHADKHGCWWNKDIGKIVQESGLEIVEMRRYHFGTTWWFELRPRRGRRVM